MTEAQKQNLTSLIKTSAILNEAEREEWLMLLGLMNDKQMGELERILTPKPPEVKTEAKKTSLSHIVNLPKPETPQKAPEKPVIQPQKNFSKFAEHLNQILAEKDLPVGEKPVQANLPKPVVPIKPIPKPTPPPPPKPPMVPNQSSVYDIMPVVVEQPIYLKKSLPPKMAQEPVEDSWVQSPEVSNKIINKIIDNPSSPHMEEPRPEPEIHAGLQNQGSLMRAAMMKQRESATAPVSPKAELSSNIKLKEVADVSLLNLQQWKLENPLAITKRLKELVASHGYHEVLFNLQKSPVYNNYIDSGLKSLESGKSFVGLGEDYMNKKQFEDFTDLLRELQV